MKNNRLFIFSFLFNNLFCCSFIVKYILFLGFLSNILMLSLPLFSMQVLDRILASQNLNTLIILFILTLISLILLSFIQGLRSLIVNKLGCLVEKKLSKTLFLNSIKSSISSNYHNFQFLRDLQIIKTFISTSGLISFLDIPWSLIFIFSAFIFNIYIGFSVIVSIFFILLFNVISHKYTKNLIFHNNRTFFKGMSFVLYSHNYSEILLSMNMTIDIFNSWLKLNTKFCSAQNKLTFANIFLIEIYKFIRSFLQVFNLSLGAYLVIKGQITSGVIIANSYILSKSLFPFEYTLNFLKIFSIFKGAYERISTLFFKNNIYLKNIFFFLSLGELIVKNLYFNSIIYNQYILKNINFFLNSGEILVVTGNIASGKTLLLKLISGIHKPSIGDIFLNGVNLNLTHINSNIGYSPQKSYLFPSSIKKNISRMKSNLNYRRIITAAKLTGTHSMILDFEKGYNTIISKFNLSEGQKKKISLSRAYYNTPELVLLDEPDNNLDFKSKDNLITSVLSAKEYGITTIIVTNNAFLLNISDKILIINNGMISSFGKSVDILPKINRVVF